MTLIVLTLSLIFTIAKLAGSLDWSWGWILAPIWGYVVAMILLLIETSYWAKKYTALKEKQARKDLAKNI